MEGFNELNKLFLIAGKVKIQFIVQDEARPHDYKQDKKKNF